VLAESSEERKDQLVSYRTYVLKELKKPLAEARAAGALARPVYRWYEFGDDGCVCDVATRFVMAITKPKYLFYRREQCAE